MSTARIRRLLVLVLVLVLAGAAPAATAPPRQSARELLRAYLVNDRGFTEADLSAVDAGQPVAKSITAADPQEVSIFGVVRIAGQPAGLIQQVRNIDAFETRLGVMAVGKFRNPPQLDDLAGLALEPADLAALPNCQPANCAVQLPSGVMDVFRTAVDWQAPDAAAQANRVFRQMLFDLLMTYRQGGNAALGVYEDRAAPTRIASEFAQLISPRDLPVEVPGLAQHLADFPRTPLRTAEDLFYWNKAGFGLKPTIRLSHVTIYPITDARLRRDGLRAVIAAKQLYSSHYFSSTLEIRSLFDDPDRPGRGFFLLYSTRSRVSGLTGVLGGIIRTTVKNRARTAMERHLADTKKLIEGTGLARAPRPARGAPSLSRGVSETRPPSTR